MTDRLTPERLATIRNNHARDLHCGDEYRLQADNEDLGDLLGEVDRLTTDRDRLREQLELATAELDQMREHERQQMARQAQRIADQAKAIADKAARIAMFAATAPRDEAQRGAEPLRDAPVMDFPSEPSPEPQRAAEDFKRDSDGLPAVCPKCHGSGNKNPTADCDECGGSGFAWRVDLSGELDAFTQTQLGELRRISGFDAPVDWASVAAQPRHDSPGAMQDAEPAPGDADAENGPQGPAEAVGIAPEDEGIATADVHAQIAADNDRTGGQP